jgi:hypothetical protein
MTPRPREINGKPVQDDSDIADDLASPNTISLDRLREEGSQYAQDAIDDEGGIRPNKREIVSPEQREAALRLIRNLPEPDKAICYLRLVEKLTYREIALKLHPNAALGQSGYWTYPQQIQQRTEAKIHKLMSDFGIEKAPPKRG